jgi:hypothetical protein
MKELTQRPEKRNIKRYMLKLNVVYVLVVKKIKISHRTGGEKQMNNKILRDGTEHLEELEPIFMGLDFGYPEMEKIIMMKLCQSTGVLESYLIQSPKSRP